MRLKAIGIVYFNSLMTAFQVAVLLLDSAVNN